MEIEQSRWRVVLWLAHVGYDEGRGCEKNTVTSTNLLYLAGTIQSYNKVPSHKATEKNCGVNTNTRTAALGLWEGVSHSA